MNGPRRICPKPSFQNLLCRANIGPQGNQAQRRSGQGGASHRSRALRQPGPASGGASHRSRALRQPGPASLGAGWYFHYNKVGVRTAGGGGAAP
ncbi:hypothetical protein PR001_g28333 [Phytophthora rubi]|uniref:Uncharacterized protein n=1 Tax=Phytophthora rubi TaxID=129364 RepID=A0A6A3HAY3_9STRA|nr:hypothetical protein PR001_g28333 [Phytophthora rubi]